MEKKSKIVKKNTRNIQSEIVSAIGENGADKEIYEAWHKVDGTPIDDIKKYIYDYKDNVDKFDSLQILIGSDGLIKSYSKKVKVLKIATVICFYVVGKGGHIIKRRINKTYDRFIKTNEKLEAEINETYKVAMYFKEIGIEPIIHLDLNPDENFGSFSVYESIRGWFEGLGFVTEYKQKALCASFAADHYL